MTTRYLCPVFGCAWTYDRRDRGPADIDWATVPLDAAVPASGEDLAEQMMRMLRTAAAASIAEDYMTADKVTTAHLDTHTSMQWLETLATERHTTVAIDACGAADDRLRDWIQCRDGLNETADTTALDAIAADVSQVLGVLADIRGKRDDIVLHREIKQEPYAEFLRGLTVTRGTQP